MKESNKVLAYLKEIANKSLVMLQKEIEQRTANHQRERFVQKCIEPLVSNQVEILAEELNLKPKFIWKMFSLAVLHQSQDGWHNLDPKILAGAFLSSFDGDGEKAGKALHAFLESESQTVVNYFRDRNGFLRLRVNLWLDPEEMEELDKYQFPMPLVCKPSKLSKVCNGYLLGRTQPSSYFNEGMVYYDLERANSIGFTFSEFMDIDMPYHFDVKIFKDKEQFIEADKAFALKEDRAELIYHTFSELGISEFFFAHFVDGRGRIYCEGWQFSEQGRDLDKARLAFSKNEPVNALGMDALRIGIANALGHDKESYQDRINFVLEHDAELEKLMLETEERSDYPEGHQTQYKADEPYIGMGLVHYYRKAQAGKPVNCIVYADAVNQGFQLQSIICSDRDMMELTCAIGTRRNDLYNWLLKACGLEKKYRAILKKAVVPMGYGATRAAKEKVGEYIYNLILKATRNSPTWKFIRHIPQLWKPEWTSVSWTLPDGMKTLTYPKDREGVYAKKMSFLGEEINLPYRPKEVHVERSCCLGPNMIHSIDGFIAREMMTRCYYDPKKIQWIKDYLWGLAPSFSEKCDMEAPSTKELVELLKLGKECNWYSFHILDVVNAYNIHLVPEELLKEMLNELPQKPFAITRIHDSFGCHPNYLRDVMVQYRHCLYHLGVSNLVQHIADEIGIKLQIPRKNLALMEMIKEEMYALC